MQKQKPERGRVQRGKKKGMREHERRLVNIAFFFSTPPPRYFPSSFPHAQSTITYRTVERSNLLLSNYLSRGLLSISFITSLFNRSLSLSLSLSLFLSHIHTHTNASTHTLSLSLPLSLSHTPCNYTFSLCWSFLLPAWRLLLGLFFREVCLACACWRCCCCCCVAVFAAPETAISIARVRSCIRDGRRWRNGCRWPLTPPWRMPPAVPPTPMWLLMLLLPMLPGIWPGPRLL